MAARLLGNEQRVEGGAAAASFVRGRGSPLGFSLDCDWFVLFFSIGRKDSASAGPGCPRFPFRFGTSPPPLPAFLSFLSRLVVGSGRYLREIR